MAFSLTTDVCNTEEMVGTGGNFTDLDISVKVMAAPRTLMAFNPRHMHGSTTITGRILRGMSITFSKQVKDAYDESLNNVGIVATDGNGHESDE